MVWPAAALPSWQCDARRSCSCPLWRAFFLAILRMVLRTKCWLLFSTRRPIEYSVRISVSWLFLAIWLAHTETRGNEAKRGCGQEGETRSILRLICMRWTTQLRPLQCKLLACPKSVSGSTSGCYCFTDNHKRLSSRMSSTGDVATMTVSQGAKDYGKTQIPILVTPKTTSDMRYHKQPALSSLKVSYYGCCYDYTSS